MQQAIELVNDLKTLDENIIEYCTSPTISALDRSLALAYIKRIAKRIEEYDKEIQQPQLKEFYEQSKKDSFNIPSYKNQQIIKQQRSVFTGYSDEAHAEILTAKKKEIDEALKSISNYETKDIYFFKIK